eukprot:5480757-Prymnesium_polylepis.1
MEGRPGKGPPNSRTVVTGSPEAHSPHNLNLRTALLNPQSVYEPRISAAPGGLPLAGAPKHVPHTADCTLSLVRAGSHRRLRMLMPREAPTTLCERLESSSAFEHSELCRR